MKSIIGVFLTLFFLVTPSLLFANDAPDAKLESISVKDDSQKGETVVFKLNGAHIPKVFTIKGEKPRVVFDFLDTRYSDLINNMINTKGNLIQRIRVGIHNEPEPKTRVVVDLVPDASYEIEQDFVVEENILSISIFHATEARMEEEAPAPVAQDEGQKEADKPFPAAEAEPVAAPVATAVQAVPAESAIPATPALPATRPEPAPETAAELSQQALPESPPAPFTKPLPAAASAPAATTPSALPESPPAPKMSEPLLSDISFDDSSNKGEMVLFKLNDFYPPIVFGIEKGNPRVVCDFLDTQMGVEVRPNIMCNGKFVQGIRVAKHEDPTKIRVVLDLVPSKNYDLQQVFFKEDNLFVIIVNSYESSTEKTPEIPVKADS